MNSYIIALYVFQFGLLQPVASLVNSQWPIAVFSLFLTFTMLFNNGLKIKKYVIICFVIISIYFLSNALIYKGSSITILLIFIEFILKGFSGFLIGSLSIDNEQLYDAFLKISVINFFAIVLFPFVTFLDSMNYMRFGYAMAPSVIMFFYAIINKRNGRFTWVLLTGISLILTAIYGSRGPLVAFTLFGFLYFLFTKRVTFVKKLSIGIVITSVIGVILKYNLLVILIDYIYLQIGIKSYALAKLRIMLSKGVIESSSGRDEIYRFIWGFIKQSPVFGHGIGYAQATLNFTAHNVFLQILLEAGIIGLLIWICIGIYSINTYRKISVLNETGLFQVITLLVSLALGRLLISSDMWLRPELWLTLSMLINYKYTPKYMRKGMVK